VIPQAVLVESAGSSFVPPAVSPEAIRSMQCVINLPMPAGFDGAYCKFDAKAIAAPSIFSEANAASQAPGIVDFEGAKIEVIMPRVVAPDTFMHVLPRSRLSATELIDDREKKRPILS
jgi:hypothetical protein